MAASENNKIIGKISKFFENWVKPIFHLVVYLRVPAAIAVVTCLIFTQVDQTIEVYRSIALDGDLYKAAIALLSVSTLTIFIWYTSRFLILERPSSDDDEKIKNCHLWLTARIPKPLINILNVNGKNNDKNLLIDFTPRLLGIIPMIGLICGIWQAWNRSINEDAKFFSIVWTIVSSIVGILIFGLFVKRTDLFGRCFLGSKSQGEGLFSPQVEIGLANLAYIVSNAFSLPLIAAATDTKFSSGVVVILALAVLLNIILYSWHSKLLRSIALWCIASLLISVTFVFILPPTAIPNLVGAVSVVAIALTILVVVFSTIYNWALQNKIPALTILLGIVAVSSWSNWNDNHRFRQVAQPPNPPIASLEDSFNLWLASRPDRDRYADRPYPVYIASAQGGGIFAAYHAATALAKLTEYVPSFPQHIFAISSVSGGSLGSSAFASLVKQDSDRSQSLSEKVSTIFGQDLLSPLLTLGFLPDLTQRFIPISIYDWDRANGLEIAFENAWNKLDGNDGKNPLKQSFYQHWQPQGIAPALVLNTTVVETGKRLVISPFKILSPSQENIVLDENNLDLRLSTAAGLSARFPLVTPVGWYQRSSDGSKLRLADGGYFDNSGIPTALDIGRTLQKMKGDGNSFKVIYVAITERPTNGSQQPPEFSGLNEVFSPFRALFRAREARSLNAIELSTYTINDGIPDPLKLKFRTLMLQKVGSNIKLPLGWQLSTRSQKFIDGQTPEPNECNVEKFKQTFSSNAPIAEVYNHNSCVAKSIQDDLS